MYHHIYATAEPPSKYVSGGFHPVHLGDVFNNRYLVVRKLGFGSFSTVWLAKDQAEHRYVSLKVCTALASQDQSHETIVLRSIADSNVSHPGHTHLQKLLDTFTHTGPYGSHRCLVFEPLGRSFAPLVANIDNVKNEDQQYWTMAFTREVCRQLLLAVDCLHSQGIMHRDIQPGNVLLAPNSDINGISVEEINSDINLEMPGDDVEEEEDDDEDEEEDDDIKMPVIQRVKRLDGQPLSDTEIHYVVDPCPLNDGVSCDNKEPFKVVLIDLGTACLISSANDGQQTYPIGLRSPEAIIGRRIDEKADMWALGLTMYQIVTRHTLMTVSEYEDDNELTDDSHIESLIARLGPLPDSLRTYWSRADKWVDDSGRNLDRTAFQGKGYFNGSLGQALQNVNLKGVKEGELEAFESFILRVLVWEPEKRASAKQLLKDPWMTDFT